MRVTVDQYAAQCDQSVQTVYRKLRAGKLQGVKESGRWWVVVDDQEDDQEVDNPDNEMIAFLREQIRVKDDQIERLQLTIAAMTQERIAMLEDRRSWWSKIRDRMFSTVSD